MSMCLDMAGLLNVTFYLKVGQDNKSWSQSGTYKFVSGLEKWFLAVLKEGLSNYLERYFK